MVKKMQDVKYYKDLSHNYIIFKDDRKSEISSFQYKMIAENNIRFFLSCTIRTINNDSLLYYEISSMQSLKNYTLVKELDFDLLLHLFESLDEAVGEAKEYLLQSNGILLHPEYIFVEPEKKYFSFIYYPGVDNEHNILSEFGEYLLQNTNHGDEKAVNIVYKIYELIQEDGFVLSKVLELFHTEESQISAQPEINLLRPASAEDYQEPENEQGGNNDTEPRGEEEDEEDDYDPSDDTGEKQKRIRLTVTLSLFLICILSACALVCARYFYALTMAEGLLAVGCAILLVIVALILLVYLITSPTRGMKLKKKKEDLDNITWGDRGSRSDSEQEQMYYGRSFACAQKDERVNEENVYGNKHGENDEIYGNTIFLANSSEYRENKLYGVNKGNKQHISLSKLPCTVGKMAGGVDYILMDDSVSRIHARFTSVQGDILITDLNSTNGTFKNGLRMEPNCSLAIEPGDEIRLGRMEFIFR